ncbi:MAG: hypothetical protein JOZ57_00685 [Abitibacteriaceae bacterium]|nr:hypothetical protein [Abditibacteriaceae bacterium]
MRQERSRHWCNWIVITTILWGGWATVVHAAPVNGIGSRDGAVAAPEAVKTQAPPPRPVRLEMPAAFDQATVQQLLDTVEQGRNATILKIGYFMRRGQPPLPVEQGYELLRNAINKERVGSRRWFTLEEVRGWAAYRSKDIAPDEGFEAYAAIFDHAGEAKAAGAGYVLNQAIHEYVLSVLGHFQRLGLIGSEQTRDVLFKAWTAYATYLSQNKPVGREPYWSEAIEKSGLQEEFLPKVESLLADKTVPKTYGLLTTAAVVLRPTQSERAVELWQQAKPLLPQAESREVARYYDILVQWLTADAKGADGQLDTIKMQAAIGVQQERVKLTGHGVAKLATLYVQQQDDGGLQHLLAQFPPQTADERELVAIGGALMAQYREGNTSSQRYAEWGRELLSRYLAAPRTRAVESELETRVRLGSALILLKQFDRAQEVLDVQQIKPPLNTPEAQGYYAEAQGLLNRLKAIQK